MNTVKLLINKQRFEYILHNWKFIIHCLFRTKRFGVNNKYNFQFNIPKQYRTQSIFWVPWYSIMKWGIIYNYVNIRFRCEIGFVSEEDFKLLFPLYALKRKQEKQ